MKNLEILSPQQFPSELAEEWVTQPAHDVQLVFDACHVGVVLRAVLFVQAVGGGGDPVVFQGGCWWGAP